MSQYKEVFYEAIRTGDGKGWGFQSGDPEALKFQDILLVPGGELLDLGIGSCARASLPYALREMNVTGIDNSSDNVKYLRAFTRSNKLPIKVRKADVITTDFGKNRYDTILLNQIFIHFPNKEAAFAVLDKVIDALKPGGHIYLRAAGKDDDAYKDYEEDLKRGAWDIKKVDDDVFLAMCGCSGEDKIEPHLFFDQLEVPGYLAGKGLTIVHTQVMPNVGAKNVLFGEDWETGQPDWHKHGMVTVIARKN